MNSGHFYYKKYKSIINDKKVTIIKKLCFEFSLYVFTLKKNELSKTRSKEKMFTRIIGDEGLIVATFIITNMIKKQTNGLKSSYNFCNFVTCILSLLKNRNMGSKMKSNICSYCIEGEIIMSKKPKSTTKKVPDFKKKEVPPKHLPRDEFELEELSYTLNEAMGEGTYRVFNVYKRDEPLVGIVKKMDGNTKLIHIQDKWRDIHKVHFLDILDVKNLEY